MRRIVELDGLRAFAILAVIGCHYFPFSTMMFKLPEFGWVGVELFFVLSGFLITTILLQLKGSPHPYKVFYARRILRIFPPYYAVMALILLVSIVQHESFSVTRYVGRGLFLQSFTSAPTVLRNIFQHLAGVHPIPGLFATGPLPKTVDRFAIPAGSFSSSFGHAWSLSIEEWFYILWAPMVLHFQRKTLVYTSVGVSVGAMLVRWLGFAGLPTYFDFFSRIDVLLGGAILALWMDHRSKLTAEAQKSGRCEVARDSVDLRRWSGGDSFCHTADSGV